MFQSAYLPKIRNSAYSLNTLYIAESAQLYSASSPTKISLISDFRRKSELSTFLLKALKTIRKRTVTKTMLNLTLSFWRQCSVLFRALAKMGSDQNFEYLGEFEDDF
jgi:hypothetical protein